MRTTHTPIKSAISAADIMLRTLGDANAINGTSGTVKKRGWKKKACRMLGRLKKARVMPQAGQGMPTILYKIHTPKLVKSDTPMATTPTNNSVM